MSIQFQDSLRLQPGNALTRGSASAAHRWLPHLERLRVRQGLVLVRYEAEPRSELRLPPTALGQTAVAGLPFRAISHVR
jgi:hypothetical protein